MNAFPYGKAALSIFMLMALSGIWIGLHPAPRSTATLVYWTFTKQALRRLQKKSCRPLKPPHPGVTVDLQLVSNTALATRLQAALLANLDVPDLCEVEISQAGSLFRGPLKDVGMDDLTDRLQTERIGRPDGAGSFFRLIRAGAIFSVCRTTFIRSSLRTAGTCLRNSASIPIS